MSGESLKNKRRCLKHHVNDDDGVRIYPFRDAERCDLHRS